MSGIVKTILLETSGLGIIFYSPGSVAHIEQGDDYFGRHYMEAHDVERHVREGSIVGFCTGTAGNFELRILRDAPDLEATDEEFQLRLALNCQGGRVCFRDLNDLADWETDCPKSQQLLLEDGIYEVTITSNTPASGILGDHQVVDIYFERVESLPQLRLRGAPYLCP
ncbi:hypothetical protein AB1L30_22505 [Bremerella sp. JC817]|uniref:hypothetical protein n=1 Tax=Bremerella sp. JC817 TaxID=3231756 RepID=UPI00345A1C2C